MQVQSTFKQWFVLSTAMTITILTIAVTMQQNYRMTANDPQIQTAHDLAGQAANGKSPELLIGQDKIDIDKSLAPFAIFYDENGTIIASNAVLDGATPKIPKGVLEASKSKNDNRVTWQPKTGVREATVTVYHHGSQSGFVTTGRNLREAESRISHLEQILFIAWLISVIVLAAEIIFLQSDK